MILIITEKDDIETREVCKWLNYQKKDFIVETNIINLFRKSNWNYSSVWYRKLMLDNCTFLKNIENFNTNQMERFLDNELFSCLPYIKKKFNDIVCVGDITNIDLNKLNTLSLAQNCGLNIPEFYVIASKNKLEDILLKHSKVIVKPLSNIESFKDTSNEFHVIPYTSAFTSDDLNAIPKDFFPTLVQDYIEPKMEYKGFYFNGFITGISIESNHYINYSDLKLVLQNDKNSVLTEYSLPKDIQSKIKKLFKRQSLNIGTFDLIEDVLGNFYFLEINPSGNFDKIVQKTSNVIYKKIADYLA
jgi:glutathione synthase/RimK-type ligase-like ATP-grasp enzyme